MTIECNLSYVRGKEGNASLNVVRKLGISFLAFNELCAIVN